MDIYAVQASAHVWDAFLFFQIAFKTQKNEETNKKKNTPRPSSTLGELAHVLSSVELLGGSGKPR